MLDQVQLLDQLDVGQRHRAGHRVAGVGVAVVELAALVDQHLGDALADHHAAQRHVAAGHALGEGHQVGPEAEALAAEPVAGAAEAADDLVADQQDAVLVADALDLGPVGLGRHDHAAGALHRLADEGGHLVGADFEDLVLEPARGHAGRTLRGRAAFAALFPPVRLLDVHDAGNRQAALRVHAAHAAERGAGHRRAVVGVVAADDHLPLGLAQDVPVAAHHAHHGVVALRARAREEHMLELRRRHLGQQFGQLDGRRRGGLEEGVVERQLAHLPRGGIDQRALAVADVDAPQAGHRVEDLVAVAVPQVDVVGARDDARALAGQRLEVGEGVQEVRGVGPLPVGGGAHGRSPQTCSSRCSRSHGEMTFMNSAYSISLTSV